MPDTTITITFRPTVRQLCHDATAGNRLRVSFTKIIQPASAKGLDQMYIDQYGPHTDPWFSMDGIPVSPTRYADDDDYL
jgi:hypothetical protein